MDSCVSLTQRFKKKKKSILWVTTTKDLLTFLNILSPDTTAITTKYVCGIYHSIHQGKTDPMRLLFKIQRGFKGYCQSVMCSPKESVEIQITNENQGPSHPSVNAIFTDLSHRQFTKIWVTFPGIKSLKWALTQQQMKKLNGCQTRNGTQR